MTPIPETSESLLIRVRDPGDCAAWSQFNAIYRPVVYRVARRAGWQDSDAEDLAQRVMMLVAESIPNWQKDSQKKGFRSWLNRVARNALISTLRSSHRNLAVGGSEFLARTLALESPSDELERVIDQEHQRSLLRLAAERIRHEFKDSSWQAFWLTTLGELSILKASEKLNLTTGAVYSARSRIMRRLQEIAQLGYADE